MQNVRGGLKWMGSNVEWRYTSPGDQIVLFFNAVPLTFTQNVQSRNISMGNHANFTCCARGTNITLYWEILGVGVYHDCTDEAFCVRIMSAVSSLSSTLEIDITEPNVTMWVYCVVEQIFGDWHYMSFSTGQLTVQDIPPNGKMCSYTLHGKHNYVICFISLTYLLLLWRVK